MINRRPKVAEWLLPSVLIPQFKVARLEIQQLDRRAEIHVAVAVLAYEPVSNEDAGAAVYMGHERTAVYPWISNGARP